MTERSNSTTEPYEKPKEKPYETITSEVEHKHIGVITLNRPERFNAMNEQMITELHNSIVAHQNRSDVRVILINAHGKHFSSGADLNWMRDSVALGYEENRKDAAKLATMLQTIFNCSKPIIIAAQGNTYGGGLGLIACADLVLTTPSSQFCFSEVKLGLVPAVISPYIVHAIGQRHARRLFLSAELFSGEQAHQVGLIHYLVSDDELKQRAMTLCKQLIQHGPEAVQACKKLFQQIAPMNASTQHYTVDLIAQLRTSAEGQEGLSAFLEKRRPHWLPEEF